MDEADRLLDMDFGPEIDQILKVIPKERTTYLFSATMTTKVAKLQRASLINPIRVEVSSKYEKAIDVSSCTEIIRVDTKPCPPCCNIIYSSPWSIKMCISYISPTILHQILL
jgi:superfamily II DNA/RNA helicase